MSFTLMHRSEGITCINAAVLWSVQTQQAQHQWQQQCKQHWSGGWSSLLHHALLIGLKVHFLHRTHVIDAAVSVALRQVIIHRVELIVLLQRTLVAGYPLHHAVHGGGRGVRHKKRLRQPVLLLPALMYHIWVCQVHIVGDYILQEHKAAKKEMWKKKFCTSICNIKAYNN